jgi:hypothetical protein
VTCFAILPHHNPHPPAEKEKKKTKLVSLAPIAQKGKTFFKTSILTKEKTMGVSHCGLAIYIKKGILRQKKN